MSKWLYQGLTTFTVPENAVGFIYFIHYTGQIGQPRYYWGRKLLHHRTTRLAPKARQLTKKGIARKVPVKIRAVTGSKWETYWGSNKPLLVLRQTEPEHLFKREIVRFCYSKKELNYWETKYLFCEGVLESPLYFNENIGGSFYRRDLQTITQPKT